MKSPYRAPLLLACCLVAALAPADEIKRRDDAPKPLPPEESVQHFQLPHDLTIDCVAAEPLISDPTSIAWDAQGRLFVGEIHGYNLEGHLDVEALNKTGQLDRVVRRIPASDAAKAAAEKETYGTVKLLVDDNGDGRMDRAHVWADRLPPCHGVIAARDGVIAVGRPEIIFLADRDGDGHAEVRETLFRGFEITILERSINNPRWGIDNWIYVSAGRAGGEITGPNLKKAVSLGATDFRFLPDGSAIEPVTGRNSMFGQTMTDWGDRFVTPPGAYAIPIPHRYLARNPFSPAPQENADAANYNRVYPTSKPHPWRVERSQEKEWNDYYSNRYGASEATPNGYFTSACGQMIYRAAALPESYWGNHFCCDPAQNLVHRSLIERDGLRFKARRAPSEQESEFLTSTDGWFRPTNLMTGPDGAIYIVDMYREIIEDYSAIPRYLQQQYGLIEGRRHGRIWRVASRAGKRQPSVNIETASPAAFVDALAHANAWVRLTAQRKLVDRGETATTPALVELANNGATPQGRLHALYTLHGLKTLTPEVVESAVDDSHFAVRLHALRLGEPFLTNSASLRDAVLRCVDDPEIRVRLQLALTLGEMHDERVIPTLLRIAMRDGDDPWIQAAILSSVLGDAERLVHTVSLETVADDASRNLIRPLAAIVGARKNEHEIARLLETACAIDAAAQRDCLDGLLEGLHRGDAFELRSPDGKDALRKLLTTAPAESRSLALRIAGATKFSESPEMRAVFADAAADTLDADQPLETREAAITILQSGPYEVLANTVGLLLDPRQPARLQLSAIRAIAGAEDQDVAALLLKNWASSTPAVRLAILDALFLRTDRLPALLDAIELGAIAPTSLSALQRVQLRDHASATIRARAKKLLAEDLTQLDPAMLDRYRTALDMPRDVAHGESLFKKHCGDCHRIDAADVLVGPDLSVVQNRSDASVLADILQPSAKITAGYQVYIVADRNGRAYSGFLASETATSVTLRGAPVANASGETTFPEWTILRRDIEAMQATEQSLMPDKLHDALAPNDVADLLGYLRKSLRPPTASSLVLFDDEPSFVSALTQGAGEASLETAEPFAGAVALRVTPPQRYASTIDGWQYPIREKPRDGEFRYMRFAWKVDGGNGVLIELAADGRWPQAEEAARRYYAGENTSGWNAIEIANAPPTRWTVVTRDLWKDNGDFSLTGIAPTAMGGAVLFDRIELLRSLEDVDAPRPDQ